MENKSLKEIYESHHTSGKRREFSIFKNERGEFLRSRIGTEKKVLDIGCRDGVLTEEYFEGNEVLGVDIDEQALETAKRELGIETRQLDLYANWLLPEESLDVVVAGEVLEHLYYPGKIVSKVKKVLKEEGTFIGSVPNAFSLANRVRLFLGNKKGTPLSDPTHINHFSRKELKGLLEEHFRDVKITPLGRFAWLDKIFPGFLSFMLLFEAKGKVNGKESDEMAQ